MEDESSGYTIMQNISRHDQCLSGCFQQELKHGGAMQYRLCSAVLRQTVIVFRLV
jgi:hypothetical protein